MPGSPPMLQGRSAGTSTLPPLKFTNSILRAGKLHLDMSWAAGRIEAATCEIWVIIMQMQNVQ